MNDSEKVVAAIIFIIIASVVVYFTVFRKTKKKDGTCVIDKEKDIVKDGIYKYDKDLKCVMTACVEGKVMSGGKCVTAAEIAAADATRDATAAAATAAVGKTTETRVYPPTPFPTRLDNTTLAASGTYGINDQNHVVTGAEYGNGTYRATVSSSYDREGSSVLPEGAQYDVDSLFDEGVEASPVFSAELSAIKPAYHSKANQGVVSVHFYLPKNIYLDKLVITPRNFNKEEFNNTPSHWQIWGVTRDGDIPLFDGENVAFDYQENTTIELEETEKYKEFKVAWHGSKVNGIRSIIQELTFMGREDKML
jgi:hypothetical protein